MNKAEQEVYRKWQRDPRTADMVRKLGVKQDRAIDLLSAVGGIMDLYPQDELFIGFLNNGPETVGTGYSFVIPKPADERLEFTSEFRNHICRVLNSLGINPPTDQKELVAKFEGNLIADLCLGVSNDSDYSRGPMELTHMVVSLAIMYRSDLERAFQMTDPSKGRVRMVTFVWHGQRKPAAPLELHSFQSHGLKRRLH